MLVIQHSVWICGQTCKKEALLLDSFVLAGQGLFCCERVIGDDFQAHKLARSMLILEAHPQLEQRYLYCLRDAVELQIYNPAKFAAVTHKLTLQLIASRFTDAAELAHVGIHLLSSDSRQILEVHTQPEW